eukprot:CAMPEP_0197463250 /NCGR_PEP_ID=MMETSP1175-20131217/61289_1 /TAXON_ID=1003142 /ORGANISM="Triceratium dubium, Strain CCMP147" /LENGTH=83 /DNA_ID=CAMNT_0042998963 /DNA_START=30 /DNA_END=278 /DNA_ORIENTATION=+
MVVVFFETPAGYALFQVLKEKRLKKVQDIHTHFQDAESASSTVKLKAFHRFADTTEAVAAAAEMIEGKLGDSLKKFLKKNYVK